jgi:hypothetical protein
MQGLLKKLYRDLEFFHPSKQHDPVDLSLLGEWFESLLVQILFSGLNSKLGLRREMIFAALERLTLDETISKILEEEIPLTHQTPTTRATDSRVSLSLRIMPPVVASPSLATKRK